MPSNQIPHRLSAFTLLEAMVAMVISSIVVGLSAYVFMAFTNMVNSKVAFMKHNDDVTLFIEELHNDFDCAELIQQIDNTIIITSYNKASIKYFFYDSSIVRNQLYSEEIFEYPVTELKITCAKNSNLVQSIQFSISSNTSVSNLIIASKKYIPWQAEEYLKEHELKSTINQ